MLRTPRKEYAMPLSPGRIIRVSAWIGACLVLAQISLYFATGVGQDPLQFYHAPADYQQLLLHDPSALRAVMACDNCFVIAFSTLFLALSSVSLRTGTRGLAYAAHGCMLLTGLLDMTENFHFMTMLQAVEHGAALSTTEISFQVWESLLKFHVSYLGVALLSLALPRATAGERALSFAMRWLNVPVGVLIYCVPAPLSAALLFARFGFFVYALVAVGWLFGEPRSAAFRRVAVGSDAPA
jgi:hypothetical protein